MKLALKTRLMPAGPAAIDAAARTLRAGGLVAFPTETVYGLGADAGNGEAVARLYEAKGRPSFNPLIAHVADIAAARKLAVFNADAERLAAQFWPGPLTLVLPRAAECAVSELATAGLDSIAIRVPDHAVSLEILRAFGGPVVAPSANLSGHVSPTSAQHVELDLGGPDRPDRRWRTDVGRRRIHHRRLSRRAHAAAAGRPFALTRSSARSAMTSRNRLNRLTKRRSPRACWKAIMRRANRFG